MRKILLTLLLVSLLPLGAYAAGPYGPKEGKSRIAMIRL